MIFSYSMPKECAHAGIAYSRQQSISIGGMLRRLVLIHDQLSYIERAETPESRRLLWWCLKVALMGLKHFPLTSSLDT